jgi:CBS domain containing-hemolysin-like protein
VIPLATEAGHQAAASPWALLLGVVLLGLNAFFVAAEIALLAARRARIEELAEAGDGRAKIALAALQELSVTFSGAQLGITMASLGLGAVAEPAVAGYLERALDVAPLSSGARTAIGFAVALSIVVFLHMVVGEMVPKNIALARAEAVSLRLARSFRWYVRAFRWLIVLLNGAANLTVRMVGVQPRDEIGLVHTPDELLLLVRESRRHGTVPAQDARVLAAALRLSEIDAEDAMTPRVDLRAVADQAPLSDVLALAGETGFTRFPVYHGDLDDIVGLVHVKDVLVLDDDEVPGLRVADLLRPIAAVPESRDLEHLLKDMQRDRSHAALVIDEYGGTAGMVSLEDVIEELVGDIADEFDPRSTDVQRIGPRRWVVPGALRRDELLSTTGLVLPEGEAETVSGHITEVLGRFPEVGDTVEHEGWILTVTRAEAHRAEHVELAGPREQSRGDS